MKPKLQLQKLMLILISFAALLKSPPGYAQSPQNCYNTEFHNSATSLDMNNAYLLGYLCTMDYAQYLRYLMSNPPPPESDPDVQTLFKHNDQFLAAYKPLMSPFFTPSTLTTNITLASTTLKTTAIEPNATFRFLHKCMASGYDPEAIMISTPNTIFVAFRGTDRVDCADPSFLNFNYTWNEWLKTDFDFAKESASFMHPSIQGRVHKGMMLSLMAQNFANVLAATIDSFRINKVTGTPKKVWITGHSLGGAHAQLFAMYLRYVKNITAQGLYLYESPHPGDQTFVNQLNSTLGKTRIQRFEFGDDPICTLPPISFGYARAGERNYYTDYNSPVYRNEQTLLDDGKILCALGNLPPEQIPLLPVAFVFPPLCPGSTCFHHPTFILKALRNKLPSTLLPSLPPAVPLPAVGDACTSGDLTKAQSNVLNNVAIAVENTIAAITWSAIAAIENLATNLIGGGDGNYKIACYGFKNNSKKYLNWNGTIGSQLTISSSGSIFTFTKKLTGGYQISRGTGNVSADVTFNNVLGVLVPSGTEKTNHVIMRQDDNIVGDEETWYILKVPNTTNTYVLYNWNTKKVLNVPDNCINGGSCAVIESSANSNDATQVWILEKQ